MVMRYNLSFKRILSRLLQTAVIGIIFGIAMFPFMRIANGLLYEQRAAIGEENYIRMVILWAIYTLIFSFFTFWRKKFRMVSVLLICCWIIAITFVVYISARDNSTRCLRSYPYENAKEFNRALDLIAQRLDIEHQYNTFLGYAFGYRNCLDIKYSNTTKNVGAEGMFLPAASSLKDIKIMLDPAYQQFDDLTIATILVHELNHAGIFIHEKLSPSYKKDNCFVEETKSFIEQYNFIYKLNNEEQRSIFSRLRENIKLNPAFTILLSIDPIANSVYTSCSRLKSENNLTDKQFNECYWTGLSNKLQKLIESEPGYIEECSQKQISTN